MVLKALAFRNRGTRKDAYDLYYILRHYRTGVESVAREMTPLLDDSAARNALAALRQDFTRPDGTGPKRVEAFLRGGDVDDLDLRLDVAGRVKLLLARCGR